MTQTTANHVKVTHKIFQDCLAYTNDPFWRDKLDRASREVLPGFVYRDGCMYVKKKSKTKKDICMILPQDPAEATATFISFMNSMGQYSDDQMVEMGDQTQSWQTQVSNDEVKSWSKVDKGSRRDYIARYVQRMTQENNLTLAQAKSLQDAVNLGITLGCYDKDNILVMGNRIESISGIAYNEERSAFCIDPSIFDKKCKSILKNMNKAEIMNTSIIHNTMPLNAIKFANVIERDLLRVRENAIKSAGMLPASKLQMQPLITQSQDIFIIDD